MTPTIQQIVAFFRGAGFTIEPLDAEVWRVRFAHPSVPGKAIEERMTTAQLLEFYNAAAQGYRQSQERRRRT